MFDYFKIWVFWEENRKSNCENIFKFENKKTIKITDDKVVIRFRVSIWKRKLFFLVWDPLMRWYYENAWKCVNSNWVFLFYEFVILLITFVVTEWTFSFIYNCSFEKFCFQFQLLLVIMSTCVWYLNLAHALLQFISFFPWSND